MGHRGGVGGREEGVGKRGMGAAFQTHQVGNSAGQAKGPGGSEATSQGDISPGGDPTPSPTDTGPDTRGERTDRANADALGEAVIGRDVLIQLLGGSLPQAGAVVALVQVEDGCGAWQGGRQWQQTWEEHWLHHSRQPLPPPAYLGGCAAPLTSHPSILQ